MKKGIKALLIVGIVIAALIGILAIGAFSGMGAVRRLAINPVDLAGIEDGVYSGSFRKGRFSYSVQVTVKDHRLQAVESTGGRQAQDAVIRQIFARMVEVQSVQVDTVSGASLTTRAVSKAVENALNPAQ